MSFAYRLETKRIKETDFPYDARRALNSPEAVVTFARELENSDVEKMLILYLDRKHHLIGVVIQAGTIDRSVIFPREIAKHALLCSAANVVLVHNHPSGDPTTSPEDQHLTSTIEKALDLFDIQILDHVILGNDGKYFSYAEKGLLKPAEANGQRRLV